VLQLVTSVQSIKASVRHLRLELQRDVSRLRQEVASLANSHAAAHGQ